MSKSSCLRGISATIFPWLCVILFLHNPVMSNENLPWISDFETAKAKAVREGKPLFVMMTATWCGPCKMLEERTLPHAMVQTALSDFVWVQAFEDKEVEKLYGCNGYPTLAFVDPKDDKVLAKSVGYMEVGPFLGKALKARESCGLEQKPELAEIAANIFTPDYKLIQKFIADGDAKGLKEYLMPAAKDTIRAMNYALVKLKIPDSVQPEDVLVTASRFEQRVTETGLLCISSPVAAKSVALQVIAPDCKVETLEIPFNTGQAVATQVVSLSPMTAKDGVRLSGRILLPDGRPASEAVVRIGDIDWVKTDKKGMYQFAKVPAGEFDFRVECPGGELQDRIKILRGKPMKQDAKVYPAATVGIRWALQMKEGEKNLTGKGVREGTAYFSAQHSRFALDRGMVVRNHSGSDFMIVDNPKPYEKLLSPEQLQALAAQPTPFMFWLIDGSGFGNGLHLESKSFDEIKEVNDGAAFEPRQYFKFLRGEPLKEGQVYTVFCCARKRYAKIEIIDLSAPAGSPAARNNR